MRRGRRAAVALCVAARLGGAGAAYAQGMTAPSAPAAAVASAPVATPGPQAPPGDAAGALRLANQAAQLGDWPQVAALLAALRPEALGRADRAELHRLRGLEAFFAQQLVRAEAELLAYARLDVDAHLDPATVPPEAVTYFESVLAKHRAELRALRALRAQPPRRSFALTFVPVLGQLHNGARRKAWWFGATLGALTATSLATFAMYRYWCDDSDGTCDRRGTDRRGAAELVRGVNLVSGAGLLAVYAYGVYDAITDYRRLGRRRAVALSPTRGEGEIGVAIVGRF